MNRDDAILQSAFFSGSVWMAVADKQTTGRPKDDAVMSGWI
jgi:hypothetical protein